jgi:hypothetical protein
MEMYYKEKGDERASEARKGESGEWRVESEGE